MTEPLVKPRADVALRPGYHSAQVDVEVRLNTNESGEAPPAAYLAELTSLLNNVDWNRYPDRGAKALRAGLGALHNVAPEQVFVANGSNEVLQTIMLTYGGPGRSAAVFEPTYALHSHIAELTSTEVLVGQRSADFSLDPAEVETILDDRSPDLLFFCSPNNPTGLTENPKAVELGLERSNGLVVVDEAYGQFASRTWLEQVSDDNRLVVTRTFSKTWSMAGARLGYLIGPAWVVEQLDKVVLPYHLDTFKQAAGLAALSHVAAMEARVERIVDERRRIGSELTALGLEVWPSEANFVLFRPIGSDAKTVWSGLLERSVLVRDCSTWPRLEGCLRVTVGTQAENDRFLHALSEVTS